MFILNQNPLPVSISGFTVDAFYDENSLNLPILNCIKGGFYYGKDMNLCDLGLKKNKQMYMNMQIDGVMCLLLLQKIDLIMTI